MAHLTPAPAGAPAAAQRQASVRELIAELAQVEDVVRVLPTYVDGGDGSLTLNPELLALLARERDIVQHLRCIDFRAAGATLEEGRRGEEDRMGATTG